MSGSMVKFAVEHLSRILSRYASGDLDRYGYDEISETIGYLEEFQASYSTEGDLYTICGVVRDIISYLYVARGYATPNVPRAFEYYQSMNAVRPLIYQIMRF
jgi:hypothetical protein